MTFIAVDNQIINMSDYAFVDLDVSVDGMYRVAATTNNGARFTIKKGLTKHEAERLFAHIVEAMSAVRIDTFFEPVTTSLTTDLDPFYIRTSLHKDGLACEPPDKYLLVGSLLDTASQRWVHVFRKVDFTRADQ